MSLSRISESSPLQDPPATTTPMTTTTNQPETLAPEQRRSSQLVRKASFDSKLKPDTSKASSNSHLSGVLDPEVIEREEKLQNCKESSGSEAVSNTNARAG